MNRLFNKSQIKRYLCSAEKNCMVFMEKIIFSADQFTNDAFDEGDHAFPVGHAIQGEVER